ncbi:hypothetical protein KKG31_03090 [Patescibacteria group bacterium]|nr:hypothetical protein [Patescibacteria group bacterium]MBU1758146.1 hypothetical protein [Patescibacteria group bacterium]
MGLRPDGIEVRDTFMPNEYVNRAQFGTVFSRLIFGLEYNLKGNELTVFDKTMNALRGATQQIADFLGIKYVANIQIDRYSKHLEALKQTNIMTKVEPLIIEIR